MGDTDSAAVGRVFEAAGVEGWLHARNLDTGRTVAHRADEQVVLASVFKIPVLIELFAQGGEGTVDLATPVEVPVADRTLGPFGISLMRDPIRMSLRDLAWLMIGISDNAATDRICDVVGVEQVNARLRSLGLTQTVLIGACRDIFATIAEDVGGDVDLDELDLTDPDVVRRLRAVDPTATSRSTPREVTALLEAVWRDTAAPAEACEQARRILGQQVWPHRLAAGFPEDGTRTSGKTGTLPRWRNEAGVVEEADGGRYAVAVFTRSPDARAKNPAADAAIGAAARAAVDLLRES